MSMSIIIAITDSTRVLTLRRARFLIHTIGVHQAWLVERDMISVILLNCLTATNA